MGVGHSFLVKRVIVVQFGLVQLVDLTVLAQETTGTAATSAHHRRY